MTYQVTLLQADIRAPLDGEMSFGLEHDGKEAAQLHYSWDSSHFTARFEGLATEMPEPAHPMAFLGEAIKRINSLKATPDASPTSVFDTQIVDLDIQNS